MDAEPFHWERQGRNPVALYAVAGTWFVLIVLVIAVEASVWVMGLIGLFTLPAIWELYTNPRAGLQMDNDTLTWFSGRRRAALDWPEISHVRLDTRLDFSVRATAVLTTGRKVRLPYESTPPHQMLEDALRARGIKTERHHFTLIG